MNIGASKSTTSVEASTRYGSRMGNLTRDPELRYSTKGAAWASCGLAVNRRKRNDDGSFEELPPEFYDLVCFGDLAEHVAECLHKGDRVVVVGRLEESSYSASDGTARTTTKLLADDIGASLRFATAQVTKVVRKSACASDSESYGFSEEPF